MTQCEGVEMTAERGRKTTGEDPSAHRGLAAWAEDYWRVNNRGPTYSGLLKRNFWEGPGAPRKARERRKPLIAVTSPLGTVGGV